MKKITKFDVLLLVFVLAAIAVFAIKFGNFSGSGEAVAAVETKPALVDFLVEDVRIVTAESFEIGDTVLSEETNSVIGVIENVEIFPYKDLIEMANGEVVKAEVPDKYSVLIIMKSNLSERQTGYFADGITEIKVNSETKIYTKKVITSGKVEGIVWQ